MNETDNFLTGSGIGLTEFSTLMFGLFAVVGLCWAAWVTHESMSSYFEKGSGNEDDFITPAAKAWLVFICVTFFYGAIIF